MIYHITSAHNRLDNRVYRKIYNTIKNCEKDTFLVCCDGFGNDDKNCILDLLKNNKNVSRVSKIYYIFKYFILKKNNTLHFHDPELIPLMFFLSLNNKIIFDMHENFPYSISRRYSLIIRFIILFLLNITKHISFIFFNVIFAEKSYLKNNVKYPLNYEFIYNYPLVEFTNSFYVKKRELCNTFNLLYVGSISTERYCDLLIRIVSDLNEYNSDKRYILHLIGKMSRFFKYNSNPHVIYYGQLDNFEAYNISKNCHLAFCFLKQIPNYVSSLPTKLLEYVSINLPFVYTHSEFYDSYLNNTSLGIPVVRHDLKFISKKILFYSIQKNYNKLFFYNKNIYSWKTEEQKLLNFYTKFF
jgi:hypothetical protein